MSIPDNKADVGCHIGVIFSASSLIMPYLSNPSPKLHEAEFLF